MNDKIIKKIDDMTTITESQIDRNRKAEDAKENLMYFLNLYIQKTTAKNEIINYVDQLLLQKISNDISQDGGIDNIPYGVIIKLEEILHKSHTDAAVPILKIIENVTKQPESPLNPVQPENINENNESKFTNDDYRGIKKLLKLVDDLNTTEFPEGK